jgi:uncharacterized Zn finger protein
MAAVLTQLVGKKLPLPSGEGCGEGRWPVKFLYLYPKIYRFEAKMRRNYYGGFPPYVSVAEKKAEAAEKLKALQKKNPGIRPLVLAGQALARTWWGKAWNKNLERYADYHNRIGRGRSYLRQGAVLDLHILPGEVRGLVQGSRAKPYQVTATIKAIAKPRWTEITGECRGRLDSLPELLAGQIPAALQEVFMREGAGLFPTPKEISFACSCPDWATMCKHVAAVLYGVGARLDEEPALFFTLRKVEVSELITAAVRETTDRLLTREVAPTARIINDGDLAGLFGISLDEPGFTGTAAGPPTPAPTASPASPKGQSPGKSGKSGKTAKAGKPKAAVKLARQTAIRDSPESLPGKANKRPARPKPAVPLTPLEMLAKVLAIIKRRKYGATADELCEASGCPKPQLYTIVQRLKAQGKIKSLGYGAYGKV